MKFVVYLRVSTETQGLGIEAQRAAVATYLASKDAVGLAEFVERESGKRHENRPQLAAAMAMCKKRKATLLIAKLDRLSRNVHFISGLIESGIDFLACDNPHASKTMVQMLSVFAEHERDVISLRTREALAALKARGVVLGNVNNLEAAQALGRDAQASKADMFAENVLPIIHRLQAQGCKTLREIAAELTARGVKTARGGEWGPAQVRAIMMRLQLPLA